MKSSTIAKALAKIKPLLPEVQPSTWRLVADLIQDQTPAIHFFPYYLHKEAWSELRDEAACGIPEWAAGTSIRKDVTCNRCKNSRAFRTPRLRWTTFIAQLKEEMLAHGWTENEINGRSYWKPRDRKSGLIFETAVREHWCQKNKRGLWRKRK